MEVFIGIVVALMLGILAGTFTGLIPGIHNNLIITLVLSVIGAFSSLPFELVALFIISMGLTHTFISFIPSLLLGVPTPDTALSVLPGHRLVMNGEAKTALFLSGLGSFLALFSSFLLIPVFFVGLEFIYNNLSSYVAFGLLFIVLFLILQESSLKKKLWALIIVLFSTSLGMIALNSYVLVQPLLILFTGLFGGAQAISSLFEKTTSLPTQKDELSCPPPKNVLSSTLIGTFCSSICAVFPGIGNAQAGTFGALVKRKASSYDFIILLSVINTVNFMLSFVTFYVLGRTRNGSLVAISNILGEVSFSLLVLFLLSMLFVGCISFPLMVFLGNKLLSVLKKINVLYLNSGILIFLILLCFYISSYIGVLVFICATSLGLLCINLNVRRVHLMAVLIIPVALNLLV